MMSGEWKASDLVYRQVHPSHAPDGVPSSQAFNPQQKDEGQLSVDDSRVFTAVESWDHFTRNLGFQSAGSWAVSFEEVETAGGLVLLKNPLEDPENPSLKNPAHCLIDYNGLASKGEKKKRAQHLAIKASARGNQFQPPI